MSGKKFRKEMKYVLSFLPDSVYIQLYYFARFKRFCNLKYPKTFNEKLQWLKLHDRNPLYTTLVDKVEVKKYVSGIIGEEYIVPTIGVWDDPDEIDFEKLPEQFVLKCNHDSGEVFICRDKERFDKENARKKLKELLAQDFYLIGREWPYKNVKRKVLAEEYLADHDSLTEQKGKLYTTSGAAEALCDYKLMCFNGRVRCCFTCTERQSPEGLRVTFFDKNWNVMPFERKYAKSAKAIEKPVNYDLMICLAEKLSEKIPFVRVDFYECNRRVYFGELTFYPGCGFEKFRPDEWDEKLGGWLELPGRD